MNTLTHFSRHLILGTMLGTLVLGAPLLAEAKGSSSSKTILECEASDRQLDISMDARWRSEDKGDEVRTDLNVSGEASIRRNNGTMAVGDEVLVTVAGTDLIATLARGGADFVFDIDLDSTDNEVVPEVNRGDTVMVTFPDGTVLTCTFPR